MSEADALKDWNDRGDGCHCGKDGHALNSINCPVHGRTEKQARELVDSLIDAFHDYEVFGKPGYRDHYNETKRKVIEALTSYSE